LTGDTNIPILQPSESRASNTLTVVSSQAKEAMAMLNKGLLIAGMITFVLPLSSASAQSRPQVTEALQRLQNVTVFALEPIGFIATTSPGEKDYRLLLSEPPDRAIGYFETLYASGNMQAKSYALAGFRKVSPNRFTELYRSLAQSKDEVITQTGCVRSHETLHEVAQHLMQDSK
jgi:hypothetical protein